MLSFLRKIYLFDNYYKRTQCVKKKYVHIVSRFVKKQTIDGKNNAINSFSLLHC